MTVDRPLLAVVFDPDSVPLLALRSAASGLCEILWVVDPRLPTVTENLRSLRRFGTVVELSDRDPELASNLLRPYAIDGIVAFADELIVWTAEVASRLGVRTNPVEVAHRLVNKRRQREALQAGEVPVPKFVELTPETSLEEAGRSAGFPAVLKPAIGNGGRYVYRVTDDVSLASAVHSIRNTGINGNLILEQELTGSPRDPYGDYASVECVVADGEVHAVAVTGRTPLVPPFRETGAFAPSALPETAEAEVAATAIAAARAVGVVVGCLHIEIKLTADGPRIIEVNGRVGGGGIPDIVADVTGHSMHELAIRAALGLPLPALDTQRTAVVSFQFSLQTPLGVETALAHDAVPTLRAVDGVRRIAVRAQKAFPKAAEGSYGFLLTLYGVAPDHARMVDTFNIMNSVTKSS